MLRAVPLLSTVALLLTLAGTTRVAPTPEEERLFSDGLHAFDAGDARGAERAWKQGYAVAHDPAFLVRIGEAEEKAGAPVDAADSYRRYLREAPDASDRADIEQRLARLAPPRAAGAPSSEPAREFGSGDAPASTLPGLAGEPGPVGPALDAEGARPGGPEDEEGSGWTRANITAWSAAGATVLLLGTAGFFGAQASSKEGDVNRLYAFRDERGAPYPYTPDIAQKYESAMADGRRYSRDAKIFLLAGAGTAAVACVFFVIDSVWPAQGSTNTAPATTPRLTLAPTAERRGALAGWSWSF
jgi:hypothetical protein